MAYLKPPFFVRNIGNKMVMRFGAGGASTLSVAGRKTGNPQQIPVVPFEHDGGRYIVSTRGESEWVRNLRAAGTCELSRKGHVQTCRAVEVPVAERDPILEAYRQAAGRTVATYFKQLPDPADHPTFRLESA
jgi:deazaflavin-dependent oxidoreductase (nitroreductase family)